MPDIIQKVFGAAITVAGLAAIITNIILPKK
jgi:xanthine/uracil permease